MASSVLNAPHFQDEDAAFAYVESLFGRMARFARIAATPMRSVCAGCRARPPAGASQVLRVRQAVHRAHGAIFEGSHLPLHLWLQVIHLMCASKKGISTRQIQRMLVCSMKTAWFLTHRIRAAMVSGDLSPLGGNGATVEIDETIIERQEGSPPRRAKPADRAINGSQFRNIA